VSPRTTTNEMNYTDRACATQGKLHYEIQHHNMKRTLSRDAAGIYLKINGLQNSPW
jgi:hypothetical protein